MEGWHRGGHLRFPRRDRGHETVQGTKRSEMQEQKNIQGVFSSKLGKSFCTLIDCVFCHQRPVVSEPILDNPPAAAFAFTLSKAMENLLSKLMYFQPTRKSTSRVFGKPTMVMRLISWFKPILEANKPLQLSTSFEETKWIEILTTSQEVIPS